MATVLFRTIKPPMDFVYVVAWGIAYVVAALVTVPLDGLVNPIEGLSWQMQACLNAATKLPFLVVVIWSLRSREGRAVLLVLLGAFAALVLWAFSQSQ